MRSNDLLRQAIPPDLRQLRCAPVTTCPTCGAPCGPSLSARLADLGHDPLEHCEILAIYGGKPREPCIGRNGSKYAATIRGCCQYCIRSNKLGAWESKRGSWCFTPKGKQNE